MRIVVALGGNALLRRGEPMTAANQRANVRLAAEAIAEVTPGHQLVVAHGNGPQVGLLALQGAAYAESSGEEAWPLDVLGAQTEAMIGYLIEQELGNVLPLEQRIATLLTMMVVDAADPAFASPSKPIGPTYDEATARRLAEQKGWTVAPDGDAFRRVVPSPEPREIVEIEAIRLLLDHDTIVVCTGGGGIPTVLGADGDLRGVEAVVDKDLASALLAFEVGADLLVIATDVDAVYAEWRTPRQRPLASLGVAEAFALDLAAGSMGPKVTAAARFARATGNPAVIGSLADIAAMVAGTAGTRVGG